MRCFALLKAGLVSYSDLPLEWEAFLRLEKFNIFQKGVEQVYINQDKNSQVKEKSSNKGVSISSKGVVKKD